MGFLKVQKSRTKPASTILQNYMTVVVAAEGRMVEVEMPPHDLHTSLKVAELLLEFPPGHFVSCFDRSSFSQDRTAPIGQQQQQAEPSYRPATRISALAADVDIAVHSAALVYVLFPMSRLHTRITPQERLTFARLLHIDNSSAHVTNDQLHEKYPPGAAPAHGHSSPRSLISRWRFMRRQRAARVAPLLQMPNFHTSNDILEVHNADEFSTASDEQGSTFNMQMTLPQLMQGITSNEDGNLQCSRHMMIKPKPWVPSLDVIREEQECQ